MLAISRSCFAKALDLRSVTSPSLTEDLEVEMEHFVQLAVPVVHQAGGHDHQRAVQFARLASSRRISAVSIVLPRPTSSAMRKRRGDAVAMRCVSTT